MIDSIYNIELVTNNWNDMIKFYKDILGLQLQYESTEKDYRLYKIGQANTYFCLRMPVLKRYPDYTNKGIHLSILVDDIYKSCELLEARGVKTSSKVVDMDKVLVTKVYDPEEHEIAIIQLKDVYLDNKDIENNDSIIFNGMFNVEMIINDWENTPKWYQKKLGLKLLFKTGKVGYREYQVGLGQTRLALGAQEENSDEKNNIFFGLEVDDIDAAISKLKSKGISRVSEVRTIGNRIREANIYDPEGYQIAIIQKNIQYFH